MIYKKYFLRNNKTPGKYTKKLTYETRRETKGW